jgi:hypothetical protein
MGNRRRSTKKSSTYMDLADYYLGSTVLDIQIP